MFLHNARWHPSVKDFLEALGMQSSQPDSEATIENIRQTMLDIVKQSGPGKTLAPIVRLTCRIGSCQDAKGLWYLRGEVMMMLSASKGESEARRQMDAITPLFKGLLPESLNPRPAFHQDGGHRRPGSR